MANMDGDIEKALHFIRQVAPKTAELQKLYGINEAEAVLMANLARLVNEWFANQAISPPLAVKLLKALSAIQEMMLEESAKYLK